jgi:hypothetical protein
MAKLREEEERARRVVEHHLGRPVEIHDDRTGPSMFDLRVGPADAPAIAIEVTGAVDPSWMATWKEAEKRSGLVPDVVGAWTVIVHPSANLTRVTAGLPSLLGAVTALGIDTLHDVNVCPDPELRARINGLGIRAAYLLPGLSDGKIHYTLDGDGGAVDSLGESVPGWIGDWLANSHRADNLRKLAATTAPQREVFVIADVAGAPWSVMSYLTDIAGRGVPLPPNPPELPEPLTGVWLASTFTFGADPRGVRWDGTRWSSFQSRGAAIDDS